MEPHSALSVIHMALQPSALSEEMKVGQFLFWTSTIFAGLILLWAVSDYLANWSENYPVLDVPALALAAVVWLVGLLFRYAL